MSAVTGMQMGGGGSSLLVAHTRNHATPIGCAVACVAPLRGTPPSRHGLGCIEVADGPSSRHLGTTFTREARPLTMSRQRLVWAVTRERRVLVAGLIAHATLPSLHIAAFAECLPALLTKAYAVPTLSSRENRCSANHKR